MRHVFTLARYDYGEGEERAMKLGTSVRTPRDLTALALRALAECWYMVNDISFRQNELNRDLTKDILVQVPECYYLTRYNAPVAQDCFSAWSRGSLG